MYAAVHGVTKGQIWLSDRTTAANFYNLKREKIPTGRVALGDWLGRYRVGDRVGILSNMGPGNWPIYIRGLTSTIAMGLDLFQRFLSCDLGIGLLTELIDIFSPS